MSRAPWLPALPLLLLLLLSAFGCAAPSGADDDDDDDVTGETGSMVGMTDAHNEVRAAVGVPDLAWDEALAQVAQDWSDHLSADEDCSLIHSANQYGENLFWSSGSVDAQRVVDAWAGESVDYDYDSNSCTPGEQCGHYTQIVWDSTERVGCALVACDGGGEVWTCSYDPPGNYVGEQPY